MTYTLIGNQNRSFRFWVARKKTRGYTGCASGRLPSFHPLRERVCNDFEQHVIDQANPRFAVMDAASFAAKNSSNAASYEVRQASLFEGRALPGKASNDVLRQLDKNWRAFFAAQAAWKEEPSRFFGRPSGKREQRGLYRAKNGRRIQADFNASYTTGRKQSPTPSGRG